MSREPATAQTGQQGRKVQEAFAVQRLTTWVGAGALSLSGIFTAFAAKGVPMTIGVTRAASVQTGAPLQNQVNGALDDRVVVRRVFLPPVRPPSGGVRAAQPARAAQPGAAVVSSGPAPAAAPAPKPVAATGGSTPRH